MEWKGQITIEADPPNLALVSFETTEDGEKLMMVNETL